MSKILIPCLALVAVAAFAADAPKSAELICAQSGKPAKADIFVKYEGANYYFADEACKKQFTEKLDGSIYHQIGGEPAMQAAVEIFYKKVLADKRINHFFEGVDMKRQAAKQKAFLSAAFGSPVKWTGLDMRTAHADLRGLNDGHFDAVGENLKATLEELKVKPELIARILAIAESVRPEVLNRKPAAQ